MLLISMIPEYDERIVFRLSTKQKQQIQQLLKTSGFRNVSQVTRAALQEFLSKQGELST